MPSSFRQIRATAGAFRGDSRKSGRTCVPRRTKSRAAAENDILDIGAESTRPYEGMVPVSLEEEMARLMPVLPAAVKLNVPVSIDTIKTEVAEWALDRGAQILNDVWGLQRDPGMAMLAARRGVEQKMGKDPKVIEPLVPVDLVVDHSVQIDHYGTKNALDLNMKLEFKRNEERYQFMKWGMQAFDTFKVVPPGIGIVHQVNLEYLARGVHKSTEGVYYPDTLVGTDSHTTMINGIGVVGWGVGGIEAEAGMLGQPVSMLIPEVIGMKLEGTPKEGVTATDVVLTVTQMLRAKGVVQKFVEFFGPGVAHLGLADRATIANMAPEYGATCGIFPVDDVTLG